MRRPAEVACLLVVAASALGSRLAMARALPTIPVSDFANLTAFAVAMRDQGPLVPSPWWQFFGLGLPLALSLVLRVVPGSPAEVARYATAVATGLAALAPFVIWRGALGLSARVTASLLLALWPGLVLFCGAVAQDNWVLLPSLALASLGVRVAAAREAGWPLASALLYAAATAVRQEMLVALLPLALAGAGAFTREGRGRRLAVWAAATLAALGALAALRGAATGRYRIGSEHAGLAVLGAAAPGAGSAYWTFPQTYFAAVEPGLVESWEGMRARAMGLALRELRRRPLFHAVRMAAAGTNSFLDSDAKSTFWTMGAPGVLPASHRPRAERVAALAAGPLRWGPAVALGLSLAGLALAVRRPALRPAAAALAAAMALKAAVHAVTVAQPRYFVVVTAFALLSVGLGVEAARGVAWPRLLVTVAGGLAAALAVAGLGRAAERYVVAHEEQLTYRFALADAAGGPRLDCTMPQGLLASIMTLRVREAAIRFLRVDPRPGDEVVVECRIAGDPGAGALEVEDAYPAGGVPGRVLQVVDVNGREVLRHDVGAEPGTGWARVSLTPEGGNGDARLRVRLLALRPDPAASWGLAATTRLRLVRIAP